MFNFIVQLGQVVYSGFPASAAKEVDEDGETEPNSKYGAEKTLT